MSYGLHMYAGAHTRTVHVHLPHTCVLTQTIILSLQVGTRETKSKNGNLGDSMIRTYKSMKRSGNQRIWRETLKKGG